MLVLFGVINLVMLARVSGLLSAGERAALCESTPRQVTVGDLVRAGRTVAMRLPDEGRWLVARLPAIDVPALARLCRIWVYGRRVLENDVPVGERAVDYRWWIVTEDDLRTETAEFGLSVRPVRPPRTCAHSLLKTITRRIRVAGRSGRGTVDPRDVY